MRLKSTSACINYSLAIDRQHPEAFSLWTKSVSVDCLAATVFDILP